MPNDYSNSATFNGSAAKALEIARTTFIGQGFEIVSSNANQLQVKHSGGLNSTEENPLKGVSSAAINIRYGTIEIVAELAGAKQLSHFAKTFPLKLGGLLLVIFLIIFVSIAYFQPAFRQPWIFILIAVITFASLSPSIFLSPMMARRINRKTIESLNTLLKNMVTTGNS